MESEITKHFELNLNTIDTEEDHYFYVKVISNKDLPIPKKKTILLLIDKSGSMEGENIKHTKMVIKKFLDYFRDNMKDASINLIIFDTQQNIIKDANNISKLQIDKTIDGIKADNGTFFSGVLEAMSNFIKNKISIDDLSIIFMTDGQIVDANDKKDNFKLLNEKMLKLKESFNHFVKKVDIHAIGLGKGHDPFFLEKIVMINPLNSSFQFIINETGIGPSFNAVKDMIYANNIEGQLILSDNDSTNIVDLALSESEEEGGRRIWECLSKTNFNLSDVSKTESYVIINMTNGSISERFYLKDIYKNNSNKEHAYKIHLAKIKDELNIIFENLKLSAQNKIIQISQLDESTREKAKLKNMYQNVAIKLYKVKDDDLKTYLFKICEDISPIFGVIDEILTSAYKNQIKSEVLGKAVQLAHKNIKKKKYIDELESRLPTTVRLFNKQDLSIKNISSVVNKEELYLKYKDNNVIEDYKCFLTCNDFIESLADGDCLCLTFGISRSEQAIVVPSSIKITSIYPTVISAQSFLNSIKYSINLNFNDNSEQNEQVVIGEAREKINGAIPIFLNEDHWQISQILMDRVLGWIVTLDPMGYHINQKMTFPYILLEYVTEQCFKNPDSTFMYRYFKLILDTCLNIMKNEELQENSNFRENLLKLYDSYIKYGTVRTPDSISKNSFFYIKYYCAIILGWVKIDDRTTNIFYLLVEEELRRVSKKLYQNYADYVSLDINDNRPEQEKQIIIDQYVEEYYQLYLNNCQLIRLINHIIQNYSQGNISFKDIKLNENKDAILSELNIDKLSLYAMFFQNQIHHDSAVRRKVYNDCTYTDCRVNPMDVFIYYSKNINEIKEKRNKQFESNTENLNKNDLRSRFKNLEVFSLLHKFRLCDDLVEAEEILVSAFKIKPGRAVSYYCNIFWNVFEIPFIYDKLLLLKEKHDKFKRAIKPKHNSDLCYSNLLTLEELESIFGFKKIPRRLRNEYKSKYHIK